MIKTIIFDLSEVLIPGLIGVENTLSHALKRSADDIARAMGSHPYLTAGNHLDQLFVGKLTHDAYLAEMRQRLDLGPDYDALITARFLTCFAEPYPYAAELIGKLKGRYRLMMHTDHCERWIAYILERHAFLAEFDRHFYSFKLGWSKKYTESFQRVIAAENLNPTETLFIDDNEKNVLNAKSVGFNTVLFHGEQSLAEIDAVLTLHGG